MVIIGFNNDKNFWIKYIKSTTTHFYGLTFSMNGDNNNRPWIISFYIMDYRDIIGCRRHFLTVLDAYFAVNSRK